MDIKTTLTKHSKLLNAYEVASIKLEKFYDHINDSLLHKKEGDLMITRITVLSNCIDFEVCGDFSKACVRVEVKDDALCVSALQTHAPEEFKERAIIFIKKQLAFKLKGEANETKYT